MRKLTNKEFVEKAIKIHGNKYDYSKVEYVDSHTKVCIICPEHGEFWQKPNGHLSGKGCLVCANIFISKTKIKGENLFLEQCLKVHGNKYDYSKVQYKRSNKKVCIICPDHGEFWQTPDSHLRGSGCPSCVKLLRSLMRKKNLTDLLIQFFKVHGSKYDYSLIEDKKYNSCCKIQIICPKHGIFIQNLNNHLRGYGCKKCANELLSRTKLKNNKVFLKQCLKVHGDKYDYSKVQYKNSRTKVCIICPDHGEFWQTPDSHLRGSGCLKCKQSKGEIRINQWLNINHIKFIPQKRFDECHNKKTLPFDFYLPKLNTCIEYDGELHFQTLRIKDKEKALKKLQQTQKNDKIKNKFCKENNIKLVRIKYLDINKVENILEETIKND